MLTRYYQAAVYSLLCASVMRAAVGENAPITDNVIEKPVMQVGGSHPTTPGGKEKIAEFLNTSFGVDVEFVHGFVAAFSMIIVTELGDKTFFIAAIMAMRHPRLTIFGGAMAALAVMTVLSAALGYATTVIPRVFTYYISSALFAFFGLKMLREGYYMSPNEGQEEYEEAQDEVKKREEELKHTVRQDPESGVVRPEHTPLYYTSRIFLQAFTLTFLAEWGDRSQLATIILAARESVVGVSVGGTLGHCICTGLAVLGGRFIAQRISVRTVTLVGGVVFIVFALSALVISPDSNS